MPRCRLGEEAPSSSVILRCTFKARSFFRVLGFFLIPPTPFMAHDAPSARLALPGLTQGVTPWQPGHSATDCQRGPGSCGTATLPLPLYLPSAPGSLGIVTWKARASAPSVSETKRVPLRLPSHPAFELLGAPLQVFKAQDVSLACYLGLYTLRLFLSLNFAVELVVWEQGAVPSVLCRALLLIL